MTHKHDQKTGLFASFEGLLSGRKPIPPPSSIAKENSRPSAATIMFDAGNKHGFGAGENDWLGAEAYVDALR